MFMKINSLYRTNGNKRGGHTVNSIAGRRRWCWNGHARQRGMNSPQSGKRLPEDSRSEWVEFTSAAKEAYLGECKLERFSAKPVERSLESLAISADPGTPNDLAASCFAPAEVTAQRPSWGPSMRKAPAKTGQARAQANKGRRIIRCAGNGGAAVVLLCLLLAAGAIAQPSVDEVQAAMRQGAQAMTAGDFGAAVAAYASVTRKMPGFAEGYFNLGLARTARPGSWRKRARRWKSRCA